MAMSFRGAGEAINVMNTFMAPGPDNTMLSKAGQMARNLLENTKTVTDSNEKISKMDADTQAKLVEMAGEHKQAVQGINQSAGLVSGLANLGTTALGAFGPDLFGGGLFGGGKTPAELPTDSFAGVPNNILDDVLGSN